MDNYEMLSPFAIIDTKIRGSYFDRRFGCWTVLCPVPFFQVPEGGGRFPVAEKSTKVRNPYFCLDDSKCLRLHLTRRMFPL